MRLAGITVAPVHSGPITLVRKGVAGQDQRFRWALDWTPRLRQFVKRHRAVRCKSIVGRG